MGAAPKIPLSSVEPRVPLSPEQKVEIEIQRVGGDRRKRAVSQAHNRVKEREFFEHVEQAVKDADASRTWESASTQELSEKIVRRFAKVVLLGGPMFMPTNLKEVTEAAGSWSKIATAEAVRAGRLVAPTGELTPAQLAAVELTERIVAFKKGSSARTAARMAREDVG